MPRIYDDLSDMDSKSQEGVKKILHSNEIFETGILCKVNIFIRIMYLGTGWYERFYQKLILTDRRLIAYKRGWIREKSNDFALDEITSVEYTKGIFTGKITLQGAGFQETYRTFSGTGREFATAVSERLNSE